MSKNESGFAHLVVLVVAVVVLVVAGAGWYVFNNRNKTANSELTDTKSSLVAPLPTDILAVSAVKELATQEVPSTDIASVGLEQEKGVYVYKVKLANGKVLLFNARTGAKLTHDEGETENETEDGTIPPTFKATITFDKAREIALANKPDGVIKTIKLQPEEGKMVYAVRFTDEARVYVDATSGAVVKTKAGTPRPTTKQGSSDSNRDDSSDDASSNSGSGSSADDSNDDANDDSHSGSGSSGSDSGRDGSND